MAMTHQVLTVSPNYAQEISTGVDTGVELDDVIREVGGGRSAVRKNDSATLIRMRQPKTHILGPLQQSRRFPCLVASPEQSVPLAVASDSATASPTSRNGSLAA
jgi:hypothetical protein